MGIALRLSYHRAMEPSSRLAHLCGTGRQCHVRRRAREEPVTTPIQAPIQTKFRTIDGLSIRYAESEKRKPQALLLNPWPESLFAFEPTWLRLAEHAHLVA